MSVQRQARSAVDNETILEVAAREFADKGFEGARVDEIAKEAGVNKATLYYRIGDKEALYSAVLEHALGECAEGISKDLAEATSNEEKVQRFIAGFANNQGIHRYAAPIMLREVASGGRNLPDAALVHMGRILGALDLTIEEGVKSGEFRPVNSFFVHMMIVGSLMFYSANEPIRRRNAERNPDIYRPEHFLKQDQAAGVVSDLILAAIRQSTHS